MTTRLLAQLAAMMLSAVSLSGTTIARLSTASIAKQIQAVCKAAHHLLPSSCTHSQSLCRSHFTSACLGVIGTATGPICIDLGIERHSAKPGLLSSTRCALLLYKANCPVGCFATGQSEGMACHTRTKNESCQSSWPASSICWS